ncbi:MAG: arsenate reductase family protein [Polyangiaceae bacterium]
MGSSDFQFFEYAACSTCKKAKRWLDDHRVSYRAIPIVESPPSEKELAELVKKSGLPIEKWFNTSGQSYRALMAEMGKEKFAALSTAEKLRLLAADGKMIKRPVLIAGPRVLVGFDESRYADLA